MQITNDFHKILCESNWKPNKSCLYKGSELYKRSMKSWLQNNDAEMYSTQNEGKSGFAERFIETINNKIYQCMTSVSKNVYIGRLNNIVNECINIYHWAIKMKPVDIRPTTYTDFSFQNDEKDPKFEVHHHVRISK